MRQGFNWASSEKAGEWYNFMKTLVPDIADSGVDYFYDPYIEWGLKEPIKKVTEIRKRNGVTATSRVNILAAEADLYMAEIDNKIIVKIGPKMDLVNLLPPNVQVATSGQDYAVWKRK
ncbi:hypothetical protein JHK84_039556 [Glycine max]|uniref:alpha-amylase n=1 Tax=Glycine max TaxID=3847 RepID=UPI0007194172|nr:alpha-amylase [Glycine max]XP_028201097.1 alpha-amylase-like [Glycine soja]KAG4962460.1 hypothetical protein JHK86_039328 [Glycine max]KAG5121216.1 hypothetical protein JHK84_039556 [Glycine max]|eukprot:XP_014622160.1 alpha-amylase [Glycine max]